LVRHGDRKLQTSCHQLSTALGKLRTQKNMMKETKQALAPLKHARRYGFGQRDLALDAAFGESIEIQEIDRDVPKIVGESNLSDRFLGDRLQYLLKSIVFNLIRVLSSQKKLVISAAKAAIPDRVLGLL
jgi:hypothetical protein